MVRYSTVGMNTIGTEQPPRRRAVYGFASRHAKELIALCLVCIPACFLGAGPAGTGGVRFFANAISPLAEASAAGAATNRQAPASATSDNGSGHPTPVNWGMTGATVLGGLLGVCLLIYIGKMLLRLVAFGLCVASGIGSAVVLSPWLREVLGGVLPPQISTTVSSGVLAYAAGFLVGYVAALVLLGILAKPLRASAKQK